MLTRTRQYALSAMLYLVNHEPDWPIASERIATEVGIPAKYLSTILRQLVRSGVLTSAPGPRGGFKIARRPEDIKLYDVLAPFDDDPNAIEACPFGNEQCNDANPCGGHHRWKLVKYAYQQFMHDTSLRDVSTVAKPAKALRSLGRKPR